MLHALTFKRFLKQRARPSWRRISREVREMHGLHCHAFAYCRATMILGNHLQDGGLPSRSIVSSKGYLETRGCHCQMSIEATESTLDIRPHLPCTGVFAWRLPMILPYLFANDSQESAAHVEMSVTEFQRQRGAALHFDARPT